MRWNFHSLIIEGLSNNANLQQSWDRSFASLRPGSGYPDIRCRLNVVSAVPAPPPREPDFRQGDLLQYFVKGTDVVAHFPHFGQLHLDLQDGTTEGRMVEAALETYGVLEDLIAISLSPHLRRKGLFLIHAFAAAWNGRSLLLIGGIGAGKTTTGMALLNDDWKLLSNDSPVVGKNGRIASYPGVLAAYPDTFARFPATAHLSTQIPTQNGRAKLTTLAEDIWPGVWLDEAAIGAICFPQIEDRSGHELELLSPSAALTRLLPHAVEQWDKVMIPTHLAILRQLVEAAPAYCLHLGPDVGTISAVLKSTMNNIDV